MKQHTFEKKYQGSWQSFAAIVEVLEDNNGKSGKKISQCHRFPLLYRNICRDYSLAQKRCYTPAVTKRLHNLVLRGHRQLHKPKKAAFSAVCFFLWHTFPNQLRQSFYYFLFALFLFLAPALITGVFCYINPLGLQQILSTQRAAEIENMYNPAEGSGSRSITRTEEKDFLMFGYYIKHNTSIGLTTFAGGLFFGLGAFAALIYNGLVIGGVSGHLSHPPFAEAFWPFVAGHSSWELTAIVISGTAGIILGKSILYPGRYSRADSLRLTAPKALHLAMGAAVMFFIAAFIEAFWSASLVPPALKYIFSLLNWGSVIFYLSFSGREGR